MYIKLISLILAFACSLNFSLPPAYYQSSALRPISEANSVRNRTIGDSIVHKNSPTGNANVFPVYHKDFLGTFNDVLAKKSGSFQDFERLINASKITSELALVKEAIAKYGTALEGSKTDNLLKRVKAGEALASGIYDKQDYLSQHPILQSFTVTDTGISVANVSQQVAEQDVVEKQTAGNITEAPETDENSGTHLLDTPPVETKVTDTKTAAKEQDARPVPGGEIFKSGFISDKVKKLTHNDPQNLRGYSSKKDWVGFMESSVATYDDLRFIEAAFTELEAAKQLDEKITSEEGAIDEIKKAISDKNKFFAETLKTPAQSAMADASQLTLKEFLAHISIASDEELKVIEKASNQPSNMLKHGQSEKEEIKNLIAQRNEFLKLHKGVPISKPPVTSASDETKILQEPPVDKAKFVAGETAGTSLGILTESGHKISLGSTIDKPKDTAKGKATVIEPDDESQEPIFDAEEKALSAVPLEDVEALLEEAPADGTEEPDKLEQAADLAADKELSDAAAIDPLEQLIKNAEKSFASVKTSAGLFICLQRYLAHKLVTGNNDARKKLVAIAELRGRKVEILEKVEERLNNTITQALSSSKPDTKGILKWLDLLYNDIRNENSLKKKLDAIKAKAIDDFASKDKTFAKEIESLYIGKRRVFELWMATIRRIREAQGFTALDKRRRQIEAAEKKGLFPAPQMAAWALQLIEIKQGRLSEKQAGVLYTIKPLLDELCRQYSPLAAYYDGFNKAFARLENIVKADPLLKDMDNAAKTKYGQDETAGRQLVVKYTTDYGQEKSEPSPVKKLKEPLEEIMPIREKLVKQLMAYKIAREALIKEMSERYDPAELSLSKPEELNAEIDLLMLQRMPSSETNSLLKPDEIAKGIMTKDRKYLFPLYRKTMIDIRHHFGWSYRFKVLDPRALDVTDKQKAAYAKEHNFNKILPPRKIKPVVAVTPAAPKPTGTADELAKFKPEAVKVVKPRVVAAPATSKSSLAGKIDKLKAFIKSRKAKPLAKPTAAVLNAEMAIGSQA